MRRGLMRQRPAATTTAAVAGLGVAVLAGLGVAAAASTGALTANTTAMPAAHAQAPKPAKQAKAAPAAAGHKAEAADKAVAPAAGRKGWGTGIEVPGMATMNVGGNAAVTATSCADTGDCAAGGYYANTTVTTGPPPLQAFVDDESGGTWGTAQVVPGIEAINAGGDADVTAVSCVSPGNCSAGGFYSPDLLGKHLPALEAFTVDESNGTWGNAQEVPGTATLNAGGNAKITAITCFSAGNCTAAGFYSSAFDASYATFTKQAFVVSETNGTWGSALEVPGSAALNAGGYAGINSMSCASLGNCSAGGFYASSQVDSIPTQQAMVVTETNGTWGQAQEVPGTAALNTGTGAFGAVNDVSCASAGNCSAGGQYINGSDNTQAFVVSQTNGTWGTAQEVPGTAALNQQGLAEVDSVACASPGNCDAGGFYQDSNFVNQAFTITQTNGTWGTAVETLGSAALNKGTGGADESEMSCLPTGGCAAGGYYQGSGNVFHAFLAVKGQSGWQNAERVPGDLGSGSGSQTQAVECASVGYCAGGGYYSLTSQQTTAFVVNATLGS